MTERLHFRFSPSCIAEGNGNSLQYSCLENPRDSRAWWAAVYGVTQPPPLAWSGPCPKLFDSKQLLEPNQSVIFFHSLDTHLIVCHRPGHVLVNISMFGAVVKVVCTFPLNNLFSKCDEWSASVMVFRIYFIDANLENYSHTTLNNISVFSVIPSLSFLN